MKNFDLSDLGLDSNPFDAIIGDDESAKKYRLIGREDQLEKAESFVRRALQEKKQQRILVRGDYGTGKTHHLLRLRDEINLGKYGDGAVAIYIGNLGVSIRRLYEKFIESFEFHYSDFKDVIVDLPPIEPDESADQAYKNERLRDNIIANIQKILAASQLQGYNGIFLLIDEAEDIVQSNDNEKIQYFVQTLLHLLNDLTGYPLHFVMGFSREAIAKITVLNSPDIGERRLGDALLQRFNQEIILGYLSEKNVLEMVRDRLNNSRVTPSESLYPISAGVISVVTRLTGGHPREILSILNKGLIYAQKSGIKEVDGGCILQVLATHTSFFDKEHVVLDYGALSQITTSIRERDENLSTDFERLQGKLIGEDAEVSQDEFRLESDPDILTQPIHGIRILERTFSKHGEINYIIHQEVKNKIFKGKRYDSEIEQNLDREIIELMQNPERYQHQLTKGLWRLLQKEWMAEYKTDNSCDPYWVVVGNLRMDTFPSPVSVAFAAFKGSEFPTELYSGILDLLNQKIGTIGFVLYDGFHFGADPTFKKFKNSLLNSENERLFGNICSVGIHELSDDRLDTLMGMIKLLGNREINSIEEIDTSELFKTIEARKKITELIEEKAIAFPEENRRRIIDFLASNSLKSFSITDLKTALKLNYIDKSFMQRLQHQHFVDADGGKWKISILDHNPPWKQIYSFIKKQGRVRVEEIWNYIENNFIVQTPPGDEIRMISWYLEILQKQSMIDSESDQGEIYHKLMDFSGQVNKLLATFEFEIKSFRDLLPIADKLEISISDHRRAVKQYETELKTLQEEFTYDAHHVEECKSLIETVRKKQKELDRTIRAKQKEYTSGFENKKSQVEQLEEWINKGCEEGYLSEIEKVEWTKTLNDAVSGIESDLKSEDYIHLAIASKDLDNDIKRYNDQIHERKSSKEPCITYAEKYCQLRSTCEKTLDSLEDIGYPDVKKRTILANLATQYSEKYNPLFNKGRFDEAKGCIKQIYTTLHTLNQDLQNIHTRYTSYSSKIKEYRAISENEANLIELLEAAQQALDEWNFASVELELKKFNKLRTSQKEVPKTPVEIFFERYEGRKNVRLKDLITDSSVDAVLGYIKNLYQQGKISDIEISFK